MKKFLYTLFAYVPYLEIAIRVIYWKVEFAHKLLNRFNRRPRSATKSRSPGTVISLQSLKNDLTKHGIMEGDILVVHSSMQSLASTGASPTQIIEMLSQLLGPDGTLVMPAIPKYREASAGIERLNQDLIESVWLYDVQRTPPWTGALPYRLMKTPGAVRSRFPLNTIVAIGKHAKSMMEHELDTFGATPCGPSSAWAYCARHNAKILMLGVDLAHNLTMIHVAEDCHEDSWPVSGWYWRRKFLVKDLGKEILVSVRERHPKWAMHYGELRFNKDLYQAGVARHTRLNSLNIISLESLSLLDFLAARRSSGYPYFLWSLSV